jgi:hypothetical protein
MFPVIASGLPNDFIPSIQQYRPIITKALESTQMIKLEPLIINSASFEFANLKHHKEK